MPWDAVQDKFVSPLEREASRFIKRFDNLESRLASGKHFDSVTEELQKEARTAFSNPELMDYLKTKNAELSEKVQKLAETQKTLDISKGIERDFGLER